MDYQTQPENQQATGEELFALMQNEVVEFEPGAEELIATFIDYLRQHFEEKVKPDNPDATLDVPETTTILNAVEKVYNRNELFKTKYWPRVRKIDFSQVPKVQITSLSPQDVETKKKLTAAISFTLALRVEPRGCSARTGVYPLKFNLRLSPWKDGSFKYKIELSAPKDTLKYAKELIKTQRGDSIWTAREIFAKGVRDAVSGGLPSLGKRR